MGLAYIAALVIGLGVLAGQIVLGGHGHGGHDPGATADHGGPDGGGAAALGILFSARFWVFAALAFGLSGSLMHLLDAASAPVVAAIAVAAGLSSGVFAVATFRLVTRASASTSALASEAVGQTGRVLVALGKGQTGQIRVELGGSSVDLLATTDDETIARGEAVLVEEIRGSVAHVSRRPDDLA
jgi:membrane protein implicated in regulation of membrane protease activity